jgi:hypothetical protein
MTFGKSIAMPTTCKQSGSGEAKFLLNFNELQPMLGPQLQIVISIIPGDLVLPNYEAPQYKVPPNIRDKQSPLLILELLVPDPKPICQVYQAMYLTNLPEEYFPESILQNSSQSLPTLASDTSAPHIHQFVYL